MAAALTAMLAICAPFAQAEQLSSDAKASIPHDVQQIIMVDYRAMQNSPAAMSLKDRVMPPELKRLETALIRSGLKVDAGHRCAGLRVVSRTPNPDGKGAEVERIVGIAQGQFHTHDILANFTKNKTKPVMVRNNSIYPMGASGLERGVSEPDHDGLWGQGRDQGGGGRARRICPELSDRQRPGD